MGRLIFEARKPPLLVGFNAPSGAGKTLSALRLACGYTGDPRKVCLVDTEAGRGGLYVPQFPGLRYAGFPPPHGPLAWIDVIQEVEAMGVEAVIYDSVSHEWEGEGGVTDGKRERFSDWAKPKGEHKRFMRHLLRSTVPLTVCTVRTKDKVTQVGREVIHLGQMPIQEKDFAYELAVQIMFERDGKYDCTAAPPVFKCPGHLRPVFTGEQVSEATGQALRAAVDGVYSLGEQSSRGESEVYGDAVFAARAGVETYRQWWTGASTEDRKAIGEARHNELKQMALEADEGVGS